VSAVTAAAPTRTGPTPLTTYGTGFRAVTGAHPELHLVVSIDAHEGPVYVATEDALYVTSVPVRSTTNSSRPDPVVAVRRIALDGTRFPLEPDRVTVVSSEANGANGMTLGLDGSLVVCEQGTDRSPARITRLDPSSGAATALATDWQGEPLNSPNDVVVSRDGAVWFTDPCYGFLQGFKPPPRLGDFVYRLDPTTGRLDVVADGFDKPNGLVLSPDERVLYVTDSGANQEAGSFHPSRPHHVVAFDVDGRHLRNRQVLTVTGPGIPDGLKVDDEGRLYVSSSSGVLVLSPDGDWLGRIDLPGAVNFTFGGPGRNVLFITTDTAVWAAVLEARGVEGR